MRPIWRRQRILITRLLRADSAPPPRRVVGLRVQAWGWPRWRSPWVQGQWKPKPVPATPERVRALLQVRGQAPTKVGWVRLPQVRRETPPPTRPGRLIQVTARADAAQAMTRRGWVYAPKAKSSPRSGGKFTFVAGRVGSKRGWVYAPQLRREAPASPARSGRVALIRGQMPAARGWMWLPQVRREVAATPLRPMRLVQVTARAGVARRGWIYAPKAKSGPRSGGKFTFVAGRVGSKRGWVYAPQLRREAPASPARTWKPLAVSARRVVMRGWVWYPALPHALTVIRYLELTLAARSTALTVGERESDLTLAARSTALTVADRERDLTLAARSTALTVDERP